MTTARSGAAVSLLSDPGALFGTMTGRDTKPVFRQLREMVWLHRHRDLGPGHYLLGRMGRRHISFDDVKRSFGEREYNAMVADANSADVAQSAFSKIHQKKALAERNVETPALIALCGPDFPEWTEARFAASLEDAADERLVFKPDRGLGGEDIFILDRAAAIQDAPTLFRRLSASGNWLVEAHFRQHHWFAAFNPVSVNTLRI
ncbi:MAG: hypothetical protein WA979_06650 [Pacificimonas sp.]